MAKPDTLLELLRERTREQHRRTESLPFFQVLAAGQLPVERYFELLRALEIVHEALEDWVQALNPQAGRHPIAGDLREVRAALRAGAATWRQFPYYERRYAERGRQFTRSDSAWLAMLASLPEQYVSNQIHWLGRMLAARGMPRFLLEQHLGTLHRELCAAAPEREGDYRKLQAAADELRRERLQWIAEEPFEALAAAFEARVEPLGQAAVPGLGRVLVAAVTDEAAGIERAVPAIETWVTDPARFPGAWVEAVRTTLAEARRKARSAAAGCVP
jgi:hypothetical protein